MILREKLYQQAQESNVQQVGEIVTAKLLERIPNYYEGGSTGLLQRIIRYLGGYFYISFRLGYAGFSSGEFYISYDYYDYTFEHIKAGYQTLSDDLFLTSHDIDTIVEGLVWKVDDYLTKHG